MSDDFFVEDSRTAQGTEECPYISKQWNYVLDNNSGSYASNVVRFDLGQIYNAQKFTVPQEMFIKVPIVMVLSHGATNDVMGVNDFAMGLKNGYYNLVDSCTVIYDGQTVEQDCRHKTFYTNFKMHTTMSVNDEKILGPTIGYAKDSSLSWTHSAAATTSGCGLMNNKTTVAYGATTGVYTIEQYNSGFLRRQQDTSFTPTGKFGMSEAVVKTSGKNYTKFTTTGVAGTRSLDHQTYFITAEIRLKDISSFFDKLPLVKGLYGRLEFRFNLGSLILSQATGDLFSTSNAQCQFPNDVCPFMVNPLSCTSPDTQTALIAGIYIAKPGQSISTGALPNHSTWSGEAHEMQQVRLYYPQVELQPQKSIAYSQANTNKLIEYEDFFYVPYTVKSGSNFDFQITNSIQNPTALLMIPILDDVYNSTNPLNPTLSPFTCEPATTSPLGLINFNVKLAGSNVWSNSRTYDWELFNWELYGVNSINGGQELGLSTGLLNYTDFQNNYKYIYVNLERRLTDNTSYKSISINGKNPHNVDINYHIFVLSKKKVHLNVETGKLVDQVQIA